MEKTKLRNLVGEIRSDLLALRDKVFQFNGLETMSDEFKNIDKKLSKLNKELR